MARWENLYMTHLRVVTVSEVKFARAEERMKDN